MKKHSIYVLLFCLFFTNSIIAQENQGLKRIVLPKKSYFEPLMLDPIEVLPYIGILGYTESGNRPQKGYVPFAMAFQKVLLQWQKDSTNGYELGFDAGAFTQFEWIITGGKWQRNILNSDFKGSFFFNYRKEQWALRTRIYHISSHLGDDYIIRNKINAYTPNAVNYEQLDFCLSHDSKHLRYYCGAGMVIRPETIRKRFSTQFGFLYSKPILEDRFYQFLFGSDVKILAQNNYYPNVKMATGIRLGKFLNNPVCMMLEFYQGHLPYSVFESKKVKWLGLSIYFNPI